MISNLSRCSLVLICFALHQINANSKKIICYHASWTVYRPEPITFSPDQIDPQLCTHIVYAYADIHEESNIKPNDEYAAFNLGGYVKFNNLKTRNEKLKTMLAVGGWEAGSEKFSTLAASSSSNRSAFIGNVIVHLREHKFDGVLIDWQYPATREGSSKADKQNFPILLKEMWTAFKAESSKTKMNRLLLSTVISHYTVFINNGYDMPEINKHTDFVLALTYDYSTNTNILIHNSAMYQFPETSISKLNWDINVNYTISYLLQKGAHPEKLIVTIPTRGKSYTLRNANDHKYGSHWKDEGKQGKYTNEKGSLAQFEICDLIRNRGWKIEGKSSAPYVHYEDQWVCYDNVETVEMKSKYVKEKNLGGVGFWFIGNDDIIGECSGKRFLLVEKAQEILFENKLERKNCTTPKCSASTSSGKRDTPTSSNSRVPAHNFCSVPKDTERARFSVTCTSDDATQIQTVRSGDNVSRGCVLNIDCKYGYSSYNGNNSVSICSGNTWIPAIPQCYKICPQLTPENVDLNCHINSTEISCNGLLLSGTKIKPRCRTHYRLDHSTVHGYSESYGEIVCKETGEWNLPLFKCIAECGKPFTNPTPLIINGKQERFGDSPWHAAIYRKPDYTLICGGTIVSLRIIVSAAHCFVNALTYAKENASDYEIVVSKFNRNYLTLDNQYQKSYKIEEIRFSNKGFYSLNSNYDADIALLVLTEKIKLSNTVLPACLDWFTTNFNPGDGAHGKVVGWGIDNSEKQSETLLTADLSFISRTSCIPITDPDFRAFITLDKFCAGAEKGPAVRQGDSGGGLMFRDQSFSLYHLRGIVSISLNESISITLFTDVSSHINWISEVFREVENHNLN